MATITASRNSAAEERIVVDRLPAASSYLNFYLLLQMVYDSCFANENTHKVVRSYQPTTVSTYAPSPLAHTATRPRNPFHRQLASLDSLQNVPTVYRFHAEPYGLCPDQPTISEGSPAAYSSRNYQAR